MTTETLKIFKLDPNATLDFEVDWNTLGWLKDDETIVSHEVIASTGITVSSHEEAEGVVTVWVTGATVGRRTVTVRVTTDQGRTDDRSLIFSVKER